MLQECCSPPVGEPVGRPRYIKCHGHLNMLNTESTNGGLDVCTHHIDGGASNESGGHSDANQRIIVDLDIRDDPHIYDRDRRDFRISHGVKC